MEKMCEKYRENNPEDFQNAEVKVTDEWKCIHDLNRGRAVFKDADGAIALIQGIIDSPDLKIFRVKNRLHLDLGDVFINFVFKDSITCELQVKVSEGDPLLYNPNHTVYEIERVCKAYDRFKLSSALNNLLIYYSQRGQIVINGNLPERFEDTLPLQVWNRSKNDEIPFEEFQREYMLTNHSIEKPILEFMMQNLRGIDKYDYKTKAVGHEIFKRLNIEGIENYEALSKYTKTNSQGLIVFDDNALKKWNRKGAAIESNEALRKKYEVIEPENLSSEGEGALPMMDYDCSDLVLQPMYNVDQKKIQKGYLMDYHINYEKHIVMVNKYIEGNKENYAALLMLRKNVCYIATNL